MLIGTGPFSIVAGLRTRYLKYMKQLDTETEVGQFVATTDSVAYILLAVSSHLLHSTLLLTVPHGTDSTWLSLNQEEL